jgi:hypothetical protein
MLQPNINCAALKLVPSALATLLITCFVLSPQQVSAIQGANLLGGISCSLTTCTDNAAVACSTIMGACKNGNIENTQTTTVTGAKTWSVQGDGTYPCGDQQGVTHPQPCDIQNQTCSQSCTPQP